MMLPGNGDSQHLQAWLVPPHPHFNRTPVLGHSAYSATALSHSFGETGSLPQLMPKSPPPLLADRLLAPATSYSGSSKPGKVGEGTSLLHGQ